LSGITFIHDNVSASLEWFRVVDQPLQEDASGHKSYLSDSFGPSALHAHLVAYSHAYSLSQLLGHSTQMGETNSLSYLLAMFMAAILLGW